MEEILKLIKQYDGEIYNSSQTIRFGDVETVTFTK